MDALPLHPKLVHLPVALALLMPLVSAGLLLAWVRDLLPRRAWIVALALQAVLVASAFAAMETGEDEENRAEEVVPESAIGEHAEAAEAFTYTAGGVLLLFLAASLLPSESSARKAGVAAVAGSLVVLFLGYRAGHAGGELVYQHGACKAYGEKAGARHAGERPGHRADQGDDDDDDAK